MPRYPKVGCFPYDFFEGSRVTPIPSFRGEVIIIYITLEQLILLATLLVAILALIHNYYGGDN